MPNTRSIRVLCVDDHRIVREGLTMVIDREPDMCVAATASTADEAVTNYFIHRPDLTIMDLQLGGASGVRHQRQIAGAVANALRYQRCRMADQEKLHSMPR